MARRRRELGLDTRGRHGSRDPRDCRVAQRVLEDHCDRHEVVLVAIHEALRQVIVLSSGMVGGGVSVYACMYMCVCVCE